MRQKTGTIHIKWVRSGIGLPRRQKQIVASLGLHRLNQVVVRPDTPNIRGVVTKVPHLLQVVAAPLSPSWKSLPEYVIVAPEALPKGATPKRVMESPAETAVEAVPREAKAPEADAAPARKQPGARKAGVARPALQSVAKDEGDKPRKRKAADDKETKLPKKGKK